MPTLESGADILRRKRAERVQASGSDARRLAEGAVGEGKPLPRWVERALRGEGIDNQDGTRSTIRSMSFESEGRHFLAPTIRQQHDGTLLEVSPDEAVAVAVRRKDAIEFPSSLEADQFSREFSDALGSGDHRGGASLARRRGLQTPRQIRDRVAFSARQDPDRFARVLGIANRLQVGIGAVDRDLARFERIDASNQALNEVPLDARPILRKWLSDEETARRTSGPDIRAMSGLEWAVNSTKAGYHDGFALLRLAELYGKQRRGETITPEEQLQQLELQERFADAYGAEGFFEKVPSGASKMVAFMLKSVQGGLIQGPRFAAAGTLLGVATIPPAAPALAASGLTVGFAFGAFEASRDLMRDLAFGQYITLEDEDGNLVDRGQAAVMAEIVGTVDGLVETASLGLFGRALKIGGLGAFKSITGREFTSMALIKGVGELAQSKIFQNQIARAGSSLAKTGTAFAVSAGAEISEELIQGSTDEAGAQILSRKLDATRILEVGIEEAVAAAPGVVGLVGGGFSVSAVIEAGAHGYRIVRARDNARRLDNAVKAATAATLRTRDSESFEDFSDRVQGEERVDLLIPAEALTEYFQSQDLDANEVLEKIPEAREQLAAASKTSEIVIPMTKYLAHLGPDHHKGLREDIRFSGDVSLREMKELVKNTDGVLEAIEVKEQERAQEITSNQKVFDAVQDVGTRLGHDAGGSVGVASTIAARFAERARRQDKDAFEIFESEETTFLGVGEEAEIQAVQGQVTLTQAQKAGLKPAIRTGEGAIFTGFNHGQAFIRAATAQSGQLSAADVEQGFVDPEGVFLDRGQAAERVGLGVAGPLLSEELRTLHQLVFEEGDSPIQADLTNPFPEKPGAEGRLDRKLKRKKLPPSKKPGRRKNERKKKFKLNNGTVFFVGPLRPPDWVEKVNSVATPEDIAQWRRWYYDVHDTFAAIFGDQSPVFAAAWLMAQKNTSPIDGMRHALRVREQVLTGINGVKGGLAHEQLVEFWTDVTEKGLDALGVDIGGQKLRDFVDSALGRATRSFMGDDPLGGQPAVVDTHAARDAGYVDLTLVGYLRKKGVPESQLSKLKIDIGPKVAIPGKRLGGAPSETQYENAAEFYHDVFDFLNENSIWGGGFERVAEVQAIGWMTTLKQFGLASSDAKAAIDRMTQNISVALLFGEGAPYAERFAPLLSLPYEQQEEITAGATYVALTNMLEGLGDPPVTAMQTSSGGWMDFDAEPSTQIAIIASNEVVDTITAAMSVVLQQTEGRVEQSLLMTPGGAVPARANSWFINILNPTGELTDSGEQLKAWDLIRKELPELKAGNHELTGSNVPGMRIGVNFKDAKFDDKGEPVLDKNGEQIFEPSPFAGKGGQAKLEADVIAGLQRVFESLPYDVQIGYTPGEARLSKNNWVERKDGQGHIDGLDEGRRSIAKAAIDRAGPAVEAFLQNAIERATQEGGPRTLEQAQEPTRPPRGSITFDQNLTQVVIRMFEAQDTSTLLHELGHLFLEQLRQDAINNRSPEDVRDWQVMADWLGIGFNDVPTSAQHDQLADGFLTFARDGVAPSQALRDAFMRFRAWIVAAFDFATINGVTLTPNTRQVYARLLASDQAIAETAATGERAPMFGSRDPEIQTQAEFDSYQRSIQSRREVARNELDQVMFKELAQIKSEARKKLFARIRVEVEKEINSSPMFIAREWLQKGVWIDGRDPPEGLPHKKLSRDALVQTYGKRILKELPTGPNGFWQAEGGYAPDAIAEFFGFPNGDRMVEALKVSSNRQDAINAETENRIASMEGSQLQDSSEEAIQAWDNDITARVLLEEHRALAKRAGLGPTPKQIARDSARRFVADQPLRNLRPGRARQAQEKHAREAVEAFGRKEFAAAAEAKRQELLQFYVGIESRLAIEKEASIVGRLRKFLELKTRQRVGLAGETYLEKIDGFLDRFNLLPRSLKKVDQLESLAAFIEARELENEEVIISPELRNEAFKTHYKNLTLTQLQALDAATAHVAHLARKKVDYLVAGQERRRDGMAQEMAEEADRNIIRPPSRKNTPKAEGLDAVLDFGLGMVAAMDKAEAISDALAGAKRGREGGDPTSLWHTAVIVPMQRGMNFYNKLTRESTLKVDKLILKHRQQPGQEKLTAKKEYLPLTDNRGIHFLLDRWGLISLALNLGNQSNKDKLLGGYNCNFETVMEILNRELTPQDWAFVQGAWDAVASWKELAFKLEQRMSGVAPPAVVPTPLETAVGTLRGGYWPVVYDPARSKLGQVVEAKGVFGRRPDGYTSATTGHGHLKARTNVIAPILLDVSVMSTHLDHVAMDLAFREPLAEVGKLLSHPVVDAALTRNLGRSFSYNDFWLPWLQNIAGDTRGTVGMQWWNRGFRTLRKNATVFTLGLSDTTLIVQPFGHFNAIKELRQALPRNGMKHFLWGFRAAFAGLDSAKMKEQWDRVHALSAFMLDRSASMSRDQRDIIRDATASALKAFPVRKAQELQAFAMELIGRVQKVLVDYPIWLAAFRGGVEEHGLGQDEAVQFADRMVRQSQGGGGIIDQSAIERGFGGNEFFKANNLFFSYMNQVWQQLRSTTRGMRFRTVVQDLPAFLANYMLVVSLPGLFATSMYAFRYGRFPDLDDDDFEKELALLLLEAVVLEGAATVPIVRDYYPLLLGERVRRSAALEIFHREIRDLRNYQDGMDLMFDVLRTGALLGGIPAGKPLRRIEEFIRPEDD